MNDSQMLAKLRRIDKFNREIQDILLEIESSNHPNAAKIALELRANYFGNVAWAEHCFIPKSPHWMMDDEIRIFKFNRNSHLKTP